MNTRNIDRKIVVERHKEGPPSEQMPGVFDVFKKGRIGTRYSSGTVKKKKGGPGRGKLGTSGSCHLVSKTKAR